jgi:WD40 repeat protein
MTGNSIIYSLSISSDDKNILAAGFGDSSLRLWNIQDLI